MLGQILGDFLEQNINILLQYRPERINSNFEDFFSDVLTGGCTDEKLISDQISLMGWDSSDPFGLAIIDMEGRDESIYKTVMYEIESRTKWMCFHHGSDLVIIASLKQSAQGRNKSILDELASRYSMRIFSAIPFLDIRNMGQQYELLTKIRYLNEKVNACSQYRCINALELAPYYYIDKLRHDNLSRSLCHPDAEKLIKQDKENGTDLFNTYLTFLLNDRNLVKTAKDLNIHRNTLVYRVEKIHEIISANDDEFVQKQHLLMSLLILQQELMES